MFESRLPISVQFELTYDCNNRCIFCYNQINEGEVSPLITEEVKRVLDNISFSGILSVNFNGGEPLLRSDFFEIAGYAKNLGLDIHLNTNATLVRDTYTALKIAELFPAVCVSVLSGKEEVHDLLSGRKGAFQEVLSAIRLLQDKGVYVAVNVMLSSVNIGSFSSTLSFLYELGIQTVLITRYVPCGAKSLALHITDKDFLDCLRLLYNFQQKAKCFARIALPQPLKVCTVPQYLRAIVKEWNIPCHIGLCTASVNCDGSLVPCNLVKKPKLGNLLYDNFVSLWSKFDGGRFSQYSHLMQDCIYCREISFCGGGCKGFNDGCKTLHQ